MSRGASSQLPRDRWRSHDALMLGKTLLTSQRLSRLLPSALGWSRFGDPAEQLAAMSGPYEAFGDCGVAFIIDL